MAYPGQMPYGQAGPVGKTRNPWVVWLLSIVTFGIYYMVWWYSINDELRRFSPQIKVNPGLSVVALFFGVSSIVTNWNTSGRIGQAQSMKGQPACSQGIALLVSFVGFGPVYFQSQLNKVWAAAA